MFFHIPLITQRFKDLNPLFVGWQDCKKGHSYGPATRGQYIIHYIVSGKGIFKKGETTYSLSKGNIFLIRPDELIYYKADEVEPWSYIWIGFEGDAICNLLELSGFSDNTDALYLPQCGYIFKNTKESKDLNQSQEIYICGKLYELFAIMIENNSSNNPQNMPDLYVQKAKEYFNTHYSINISIEHIAYTLGINRRYLCRIFKKKMGETPQSYLINLRLERAALLLTQYNFSVGDVSRITGYTDIYNFSKMFKKKYGLSPMNYYKVHKQTNISL